MRFSLLLALPLLAGCGRGDSAAAKVSVTGLPEPVARAVKEHLPDVRVEKAWRGPGGDYGVRGRTRQGRVRTLYVRPSGEVVRVE